jgi:hypothetical protein
LTNIIPTEGPDDAHGHLQRLSDPGELPVEGGRARLPLPSDEDDAQGHLAGGVADAASREGDNGD